MKIAVIGGAGTRTPLILQEMAARRPRLGLEEVALMDIDGQRLELIARLGLAAAGGSLPFQLSRTTRLEAALQGADAVITTFRVGGMEGRVIDERVPLARGFLGQETTGAGGFAMAVRSIPALEAVIRGMRRACPHAWLVNFANPSGILTEAVHALGWERTLGICDAPATMHALAAAALQVPPQELEFGYFGLNHLGWVRSLRHAGRELLPGLLELLARLGGIPLLPFSSDFLCELGMIPNEYLYYYYSRRQAVENILAAGSTRGERLLAANRRLFDALACAQGDEQRLALYHAYLEERSAGYMKNETGGMEAAALPPGLAQSLGAALAEVSYAHVALDVLEALHGGAPAELVVNLPGRGALPGMPPDAVVEIPARIHAGGAEPLPQDAVPPHCLGLMLEVKAYERLTVEAALQRSERKAVQALALHPLVGDYAAARALVADFRARHPDWL